MGGGYLVLSERVKVFVGKDGVFVILTVSGCLFLVNVNLSILIRYAPFLWRYSYCIVLLMGPKNVLLLEVKCEYRTA